MVKEETDKANPKVYLDFKSLLQLLPHLIKDLNKQTIFVFSVGWNDLDVLQSVGWHFGSTLLL